MREVCGPTGNQRGTALVVTMMVLVFLSIIATALVTSSRIETKIAGLAGRADRALNTAEAGVAEALERIRKGDVPKNFDPKMVTQIFLAQPGTVPVLGADSTALPTWQPDKNQWLHYSTPDRSPDVLTIRYKLDKSKKIYRYDPTKNPTVQTTSGQPIYVVTSTGRVNDAKRTIVTEVIEGDVKTFVKGAVTSEKKIHFKEEAWYCGYNHVLATPTWTNFTKGRDGGSTACNDDLKKGRWEVGSGDIPGAWSSGDIKDTKKAKLYGKPANFQEKQSGFYNGPWEVLGMSQSQFYAMIGNPINKPKKLSGDIDGIVYIDADGKPKDKKGKDKGDVEIKSGRGEGFLYVEGELKIKGEFTYRGLIYATGKIQIDGKTWILGGLISGRDIHIHSKKQEVAVLYSRDAIARGIGQYVGPFVTLSWREMP